MWNRQRDVALCRSGRTAAGERGEVWSSYGKYLGSDFEASYRGGIDQSCYVSGSFPPHPCVSLDFVCPVDFLMLLCTVLT